MKDLLPLFFEKDTIAKLPLAYNKFDIIVNEEKMQKMKILHKETISNNYNTTKMKVQSCYKPISRIINLKDCK